MSQAKGIGGILDRVVGVDDLVRREHPQPAMSQGPSVPAGQNLHRSNAGETAGRVQARRGRPLGSVQPPPSREPKAKVTVWISQKLIDQYRDWSWDARCPLSRLMQQAMEDYLSRHRTTVTP